jgi:hypothetical protein
MDKDQTKSARATLILIHSAYRHILSKSLILLTVGILGGVAGIIYAWMQKPDYIAELTFAPENDKGGGLGMYAGLAAQFGVDIAGGNSGGAFEGENLSAFLKSNLLIEKTLLTPVVIASKKDLLINHFIAIEQAGSTDNGQTKTYRFPENYQYGNRSTDSILKGISTHVTNALTVDRADKKLNIIKVKMKFGHEEFAKLFVEHLVNNGIDYYVDYRSGKSRTNVALLQRQADSVKSLITGGISTVAASNDLNINPLRQVVRAGVQRKQVDLQVNSKVYEELVKQLEISKISLRRETPFIQIIDTPRLPLEKKKLGRLKGGVIASFALFFITFCYLLTRFFWKDYTRKLQLTTDGI